MLKQQAKIIVTSTNPSFRASDGWPQRFKMCHNLVMQARTSMAQKLPGDLESKMESFRNKVHSIRNRTDIDCRLPVFFWYMYMVPGWTVDVKGRKAVHMRTTGADERNLRVVLSCTANRDMPPPMIIFKGRSIKGLKAPKSVITAHQEKGWKDGAVWNKSCQFNQPGAESLLIMNSFS